LIEIVIEARENCLFDIASHDLGVKKNRFTTHFKSRTISRGRKRDDVGARRSGMSPCRQTLPNKTEGFKKQKQKTAGEELPVMPPNEFERKSKGEISRYPGNENKKDEEKRQGEP
jgi:hypothetical protein